VSNFFADISSKIIALANPVLSQPDIEREMVSPPAGVYSIIHDLPVMPFFQDVGIPQTIVTDSALEEVHEEFGKICRQFRIRQEQTVPYSPWSNLAESTIREQKVDIRRSLRRSKAPSCLWCCCGKWVAAIRQLTALDMPQLQGRVPDEEVLGSTPDISQYAQFDWY
jgi:hypothetical protein